jgi:hypothetical protein
VKWRLLDKGVEGLSDGVERTRLCGAGKEEANASERVCDCGRDFHGRSGGVWRCRRGSAEMTGRRHAAVP